MEEKLIVYSIQKNLDFYNKYNNGYSHIIEGKELHISKGNKTIILNDDEIIQVLKTLGIATKDFLKGYKF